MSGGLPAYWFRSRPQPWWIAVGEGGVAQQWEQGRAAQRTESFQLCPPALYKILLHVLGIRKGGVEENQKIVLQNSLANLSTVCTAVARAAFKKPGKGRHTVSPNQQEKKSDLNTQISDIILKQQHLSCLCEGSYSLRLLSQNFGSSEQ